MDYFSFLAYIVILKLLKKRTNKLTRVIHFLIEQKCQRISIFSKLP